MEALQKKITMTVLVIIFLLGASLFIYPTVSNWLNQQTQSRAAANYLEAVRHFKTEEYQAEKEKAHQYNQWLTETYSSLNEAVLSEEKNTHSIYKTVLNGGENGIMGILEIPVIDVYLPIYHGTDDEVLQVGIGHYLGSSMPVGGKSSHAVLTGHRGLPSAKLLTDIDKMQEKDLFYIHVLDETLTYQVDDIRTVTPLVLESMDIMRGEDYVTLVTCTPYGINTHRLLVRGKRVPTDEKTAPAIANVEKQQEENYIFAVVFIIVLIIFVTAVRKIRYQRKKHRPSESHEQNKQEERTGGL